MLYHYHDVTTCIADPGTGHSTLLGYARDGFGIYGNRGETGAALTNADAALAFARMPRGAVQRGVL